MKIIAAQILLLILCSNSYAECKSVEALILYDYKLLPDEIGGQLRGKDFKYPTQIGSICIGKNSDTVTVSLEERFLFIGKEIKQLIEKEINDNDCIYLKKYMMYIVDDSKNIHDNGNYICKDGSYQHFKSIVDIFLDENGMYASSGSTMVKRFPVVEIIKTPNGEIIKWTTYWE